ncbi:MAG: PDZ domain-containing protein [Armatimonadetes bacterium]|nr:PDZ domain-containing protein [Armatimonadota bacterium]
MKEQNSFWTKPAVWIVGGVGIGVFATATVLTGSGLKMASAQSTPNVKIAQYASSTPGYAALEQLDSAFAAVSEAVSPSVVHIKVGDNLKPSTKALLPGQTEQGIRSQGSGFIYRADGWIVTNDHVVDGAKEVIVVFNDGRELSGKVIRSGDSRNDVALVKVEANDLPVATVADSGKVRVGQFALAFGSPFGLENSVTIGHISALGRASLAGGGAGTIRSYAGMIQTDAPINPGNSGGPLVGISGEVIGVNTSIYSGSSAMGMGESGNVGIGFAIPGNQVRLIADRLIARGKLERGYFGIAPGDLTPYEQKQLGISKGAVVRQVPETGPAKAAGIMEGDIITSIDKLEIRGQQDLLNAMLDIKPGSMVTVNFIREKQNKSVSVKIAELPKEATAQVQPQQQLPNGIDPKFFKRFLNPGDGTDPFGDAPTAPERAEKPSGKIGDKATLGIAIKSLDDTERKNYKIPAGKSGALVQSVETGSLADRIGLQPGDLITSLNGDNIKSADDLLNTMRAAKVGDKGTIMIERYAEGQSFTKSMNFQF